MLGKQKPKNDSGLVISIVSDMMGGKDMDEEMEAKKDAFEAFADAVKSGDAEAGVSAFKTLYELCADSYEDATSDSEKAESDSGEY